MFYLLPQHQRVQETMRFQTRRSENLKKSIIKTEFFINSKIFFFHTDKFGSTSSASVGIEESNSARAMKRSSATLKINFGS